MPDIQAQFNGGSLDVSGVLEALDTAPARVKDLKTFNAPFTESEASAVRAAYRAATKLASVRVAFSKSKR